MDIPDFIDGPVEQEQPAELFDAPTCRLRYAIQTALGGIITVDRSVPLAYTLEDFVSGVQHVLLTQDRISKALVNRYVHPSNLCTDHGVLLSDLHDFFHLMPGCVISVSDQTGTCCTLAKHHLAWNVRLHNGVLGAVWAQPSTTVEECRAKMFAQLRKLGVHHYETNVSLSIVSNDGLKTPIHSPSQMCHGTIDVPGNFFAGSVLDVAHNHPDESADEFAGVFKTFRSARSGKWIRDRSRWN